MPRKTAARLKENGINPSAQRVAIGQFVLHTNRHPTAEEVLKQVRKKFPMVSRATVYNTLHLFTEKGLLRELVLTEGRVVYDPHTDNHHHFVNEETGAIEDIPWDALKVADVETLDGIDVREYQVVVRGRKKPKR